MQGNEESSTLKLARENLEFWMEMHQLDVKEKNHILNRLRKSEDQEWRKSLYRWLEIVENDMESHRKAIINAREIFTTIERESEGTTLLV